MKIFVTAIHTDSGKTLMSSIICCALRADYWKPVQAGSPHDADTIRTFLGNEIVIHPEAYALRTPESPHAAAKKDDVVIELDNIHLPVTENHMVVEGAGGCLVPLNEKEFVIDIASKFSMPVIVVSNTYLGSINHTLLTLEALRHRNLAVLGIIFNGRQNHDTEEIILHHSKLPCLLRVPLLPNIDRTVITKYANLLNENWKDRLTRN